MAKEFNMRYVFLLVSCLLLQHLAVVTSCPTNLACSCDGTDVNCNSLQLNVIPTNIPTDTTALSLSQNQIAAFSVDIFCSFDSLQTLDLSYNHLLTLEEAAFCRLITTFPSSASAHFEYYVWATVTMADNAISCDCELLPFANMHKAGIYSPFDWPVYLACGSPDWLQGQQIYYLDTAKLTCIAPNITRTAQDQDVNVVQGNSTILSCEATGLPNPTIVWTLPNGDTVDSSTEGNTKFTLSETGALYIANTEPGDEGSYKCEAENTYGSVAIYHNVTVMKRLMSETVDTSTQNTLLSSTQAMTSPVNESENSIWNSFIPDEAMPITVIVSTMVGSVLVIGASIAGVNVCIAKCTAAKTTQVVPI
ncbi:hypothetical protein Bbelb_402530 [Branchiostoma belcheri]|nr:hypothetical protein Bbelb_402530 [Branchiostoma belcheri]